jgi:signal peptidase I
MVGKLKAFARQNLSLMLIVSLTLVGRASLADHYVVPSGSMQPTVDVGDHIAVNKLAYGLRVPLTHTYLLIGAPPRAGDVVVVDSPVDDRVLLKRVAAVPGDTIAVSNGALTRNGAGVPITAGIERLNGVSHPVALERNGGPDFAATTLGPDQFLLLGDNRGNSFDGRSFGFVKRDAILGRAEAICWHAGRLEWQSLRD